MTPRTPHGLTPPDPPLPRWALVVVPFALAVALTWLIWAAIPHDLLAAFATNGG